MTLIYFALRIGGKTLPLLFLLLAADVVSAANPTIEEIEEAWRVRQERFASFECKWDATRFDEAGSISGNPFSKPGAVQLPLKDKLTDYKRTLIFDHGKLRTEDKDGEYATERMGGRIAYVPMDMTHTWDGKYARTFTETPESYPTGEIRPDRKLDVVDIQFSWLLIACCVKFQTQPYLKQYRVVGRQQVQDKEVLVLKKKRPMPLDQAEIWLSVEPPYVVERINAQADGTTFAWQTFEYRSSDDGQPIPVSNHSTYLNVAGKPKTAIDSTVTSFSFHPAIEEDTFTIHFPDGTMVTDSTSGKVEGYLLRLGGEKRYVETEEVRRGATYEELLNTDPGQAGLNR